MKKFSIYRKVSVFICLSVHGATSVLAKTKRIQTHYYCKKGEKMEDSCQYYFFRFCLCIYIFTAIILLQLRFQHSFNETKVGNFFSYDYFGLPI